MTYSDIQYVSIIQDLLQNPEQCPRSSSKAASGRPEIHGETKIGQKKSIRIKKKRVVYHLLQFLKKI